MKRSVLVVGNFLSGAGANRAVCEDLAERLRGAGWAVVTTSTRQNRGARLLDMLATAWRERAHYHVAYLDVFSGPAFVWAEATAHLLRRLGKPYVLTLRGGDLPSHAARWPGRVQRLLDGAAAVTAPSSYLMERLSPISSRIQIMPNAVDLVEFAFRARRPLRPRFVWVRAFHQIYRPALAVEVLARLSELPDATLTMVGPDKGDGSFERTREAARRAGIEERVVFTGRVPRTEVAARLAAADVFLNTTSIDNTPMSVIQAMASGLPVVSTDAGGIPHLLRDGDDALLVGPDDADAMARAARRLFDEPALAERLAARALEKVGAFDWPVVLAHWDALLGHVVATGRGSEVA